MKWTRTDKYMHYDRHLRTSKTSIRHKHWALCQCKKVYIVMRYCILDTKHQPKPYGMKWFLRLKNTKMIAKANEHKRKELRNARLNWKRRGEKTKTHWKTDCERHFSFDHFKWATTSLSSSSVNITIMITRKKYAQEIWTHGKRPIQIRNQNWSQQSRVIKAHKERDFNRRSFF